MGQDDTKHNLLFISKYPQIIHEFTDAMKDRDVYKRQLSDTGTGRRDT